MYLGMRFYCDASLNLCISGLFLVKEKKGQNSEELIIVTFLQKKIYKFNMHV